MSRKLYLIDADDLSRRALASAVARLDFEPWPLVDVAQFAKLLPHVDAAPVLLVGDPGAFNGLEALRELVCLTCWPILLIGEEGDFRTAYGALKVGASDFIARPVNSPTLNDALVAAEATLSITLDSPFRDTDSNERLKILTRRELEVGLTLIKGRSNKVVGHELGISVRTVEMHRANLLTKLAVRNLAEGAVLLSKYRAPVADSPEHAM